MQHRNKEYWGHAAAGIIPLARSTGRFLIPLRSQEVMEPGTYGTIGGKLDRVDASKYEHPEEAAVREFYEETGSNENIDLYNLYVYQDGTFQYWNFLGVIDEEFEPETNWETDEWEWLTLDELLKIEPKHFGLRALLKDRESLMVLKQHALTGHQGTKNPHGATIYHGDTGEPIIDIPNFILDTLNLGKRQAAVTIYKIIKGQEQYVAGVDFWIFCNNFPKSHERAKFWPIPQKFIGMQPSYFSHEMYHQPSYEDPRSAIIASLQMHSGDVFVGWLRKDCGGYEMCSMTHSHEYIKGRPESGYFDDPDYVEPGFAESVWLKAVKKLVITEVPRKWRGSDDDIFH